MLPAALALAEAVPTNVSGDPRVVRTERRVPLTPVTVRSTRLCSFPIQAEVRLRFPRLRNVDHRDGWRRT